MKLPWPVVNDAHGLQQVVAAVADGWRVEHNADATHNWRRTDVTYNANLFWGSGSMTWTVDSDDWLGMTYARLGELFYFTFRVRNTDVGGTADTSLRITLPEGYKSLVYATGTVIYSDAGTSGTGIVQAWPNERYVDIKKTTSANWTLTTSDNTTVAGTILFLAAKG